VAHVTRWSERAWTTFWLAWSPRLGEGVRQWHAPHREPVPIVTVLSRKLVFQNEVPHTMRVWLRLSTGIERAIGPPRRPACDRSSYHDGSIESSRAKQVFVHQLPLGTSHYERVSAWCHPWWCPPETSRRIVPLVTCESMSESPGPSFFLVPASEIRCRYVPRSIQLRATRGLGDKIHSVNRCEDEDIQP